MARAVGRLAVALILVFIASAFVIMIWLEHEYPGDEYDGTMRIEVARTDINTRVLEGHEYWDITYEVTDDTEPDNAVFEEVDIVITVANGSKLFLNNSFHPNDPRRYDNASDGKVEVQVWYIQGPSERRTMNKGDLIIFTGLSFQYQGATVRLYNCGSDLGYPPIVEIRLPRTFD